MFGSKRPFSLNHWRRFGIQVFLLGITALVFSKLVPPEAMNYHFVFCIAGLVLVAFNLWTLTKSSLVKVLTDHRILFTVSFSMYYLIGALQTVLADEATFARTFWRFPLDANTSLLIDGMNAMGFGIALMVSALYNPKVLPQMAKGLLNRFRSFDTTKVMILFLTIGGLAFGYVVLNDWVLGQVIPGLFRMLSKFVIVGILLAMLYRGRRQRLYRALSVALALLMSLAGLLSLTKQGMLLPLMALVAGWGIRTNSLKVFFGGMLATVLLFNVIGGPIQFARITLGEISSGSLMQRLGLITEGLGAAKELDERAVYIAYARFNYMHSHAGAIHFYDRGIGGNDLEKIPWVFVPRFLYEDKPIMTASGTEFFFKMTGRYGSSEASGGVFADGYYNLGWMGLFLWSAAVGFIIAQNSAIASTVMTSNSTLLLPVVFLGLISAFRIDGILLADYLGAFMYILYFLIFSHLFFYRGA